MSSDPTHDLQYTWEPPNYEFSKRPSFTTVQETQDDDHEGSTTGNFSRYAKFTPDGSAFLTHLENHTIQIFEFDSTKTHKASLLLGEQEDPPSKPQLKLTLPQASPLVATEWFPTASCRPEALAGFCFVASVRECPVKLLDARDGRLRASYPIVDHRERQIAPHSLSFNFTGERLYCGFEDTIEIFDVNRPGSEGTRLPTTPSKKSKDGLKGIISSLAFSTLYGADDTLFAAGTLTPRPDNIGLWVESQEAMVMSVGGGPRAGVVQMQFNPYRPHILYATYRGIANNLIYSWDIRSNVHSPLRIFDARPLDSSGNPTPVPISMRNQKMHFGLDVVGRYMGVGNSNGEIAVFDLQKAEGDAQDSQDEEASIQETSTSFPDFRFDAHKGAYPSVL
ncbi:guanyl nucleotide binding protein [Coprinopsis cinerea okayama7|uniref:Guanyl nucleotide binding protein n=1 Tax=Coprinopsis cinerea (strain Okayama-7 / 130 / ATCC MYA-4618 / FGSC 9003) TaxID=240176 RepID=A8NHX7_COPC7|nr:guanyl nucleotide binding protein [Coprinopsis cinerea okayama7\|eukprot:XP_001833852.2 guanyl nucleotide binding protein [Coprinopsis cinerea okayama7\